MDSISVKSLELPDWINENKFELSHDDSIDADP